MIRYTQGDLLRADTEALVNTVNTVGVMGKGIALQFKEAFRDNFLAYAAACKRGTVEIGRMFVFDRGRDDPRWIINFPTKKDWRHPSRIEYVRSGLVDLVRVVRDLNIRSVAIPPLGAGNGGLEWVQVRSVLEASLSELHEVDCVIYEPTARFQLAPKRNGVEELTPARAMIVDAIRRYSVLGFECTNLEVQKLAYFIQRVARGLQMKDLFNLQFVANQYGPYADALRHLLDSLDGSYLHCLTRLHDAGPLDPIQLNPERLAWVKAYLASDKVGPLVEALDTVDKLIDGFQSPFLMELLSTVDWILLGGHAHATNDVLATLPLWPSGKAAGSRKARLFKSNDVALAVERLRQFDNLLYASVLQD